MNTPDIVTNDIIIQNVKKTVVKVVETGYLNVPKKQIPLSGLNSVQSFVNKTFESYKKLNKSKHKEKWTRTSKNIF